MPTKTIYVSKDDQQTFDRAQELAGENLSAVIVKALSEFTARKEALDKGLKEITVSVGTKGLQSEKRFMGRFVAKWQGTDDKNKQWLEAQIYHTKKGQVAILLQHKGMVDWHKSWQNGWKNEDLQNIDGTQFVVAETADELPDDLPKALRSAAKQAIERDETPVEYLDI